MRLPQKSAGDFAPAPAGTHIAVCIKVVDLGTQAVEWQGQTKHQHKVMLSWELPAEPMDDGRPHIISQRYTFSVSEKATFRKHLEGWRGKKFTDADFGPDGFDVRNILGKPCSLIVSHRAVADKVYANIEGIGPVPKGTQAPKPINALVYFSLDAFDPNVFASLSAGLQATIMKAPEYLTAVSGDHHDSNGDDAGGDIPF